MKTSHNRVVRVQSGGVIGYCAYDGSAPLTISVFGDATFEAKFNVDDGDGSVSGPIAGSSPRPNKCGAYRRVGAQVRADLYAERGRGLLADDDRRLPAAHDPAEGPGQRLGDGTVDVLRRPARPQRPRQTGAIAGRGEHQRGGVPTHARGPQPALGHAGLVRRRPGRPVRRKSTTYAVVVEGAQKRLDIVYWWLFNYNQGKTVAGTSWGNHVSDWEHVKVKLDRGRLREPAETKRSSGVMYDHHGDQDNFRPGDGNTEFSGRQVLVHLANGDHEAYAKAGVYDRPMGTHDYCKATPIGSTSGGDGRDLSLERLDFLLPAGRSDPELQGSRVAQVSRALGKPPAWRFAGTRSKNARNFGAGRKSLPSRRVQRRSVPLT